VVTFYLRHTVDADPRHFDITYRVFNMKFHQQITVNSPLRVILFTSCGGCVKSSVWSAQTQQSTDISDVSLHYTLCVITSLYV